jgi:hypothetical protein
MENSNGLGLSPGPHTHPPTHHRPQCNMPARPTIRHDRGDATQVLLCENGRFSQVTRAARHSIRRTFHSMILDSLAFSSYVRGNCIHIFCFFFVFLTLLRALRSAVGKRSARSRQISGFNFSKMKASLNNGMAGLSSYLINLPSV